jgi:hypothetical protein
MTDNATYIVPTDLRSEVPCLQCGGFSKSVQAHFRHHMLCDGGKKARNKQGKVVKANA